MAGYNSVGMTKARELQSHSLAAEARWSIRAGPSSQSARTVGYVRTIHLDLPLDDVSLLQKLLNAEESARAARFHFERDRRRYIVGRGRLRQTLAGELGIEPTAVVFEYGDKDKPSLSHSHESRLQFNLSHSADLALLGIAVDREIGVDVEIIRPMDNEDSVAADCFSDVEYRQYASCASELRSRAFFNAWTRKEAFIKALGEGLSHPLKTFDVSLLPNEEPRLIRVGTAQGGECGWRLVALEPSPGFVAAAVISAQEPFVTVVPSG